MTSIFDEVIDRRGTNSVKWESRPRELPAGLPGGTEDLLPLWVADMDFRAPQVVLDALVERVRHGIFGYATHPESYLDATVRWLRTRHGWSVQPEWLVPLHGVVPGIRLALEAFTTPGESVVIQPPVYHPFRLVPLANGRRVLENPLHEAAGRYELDVEQLDRVIERDTRILVLCSPHNPVGRVWTRAELASLVEVCARRDVILLSDEIHGDLIVPGNRHTPTGLVAESVGASASVLTLVSATKSFNLSGLSCATAIIPDPELRQTYRRVIERASISLANPLSLLATEIAYTSAAEWLDALLAYLAENYSFLGRYLAEHAPALSVTPLEGTYLVWLDFRRLGVEDRALRDALLRAGVWLEEGPKYGTGGSGFQRINIACPRATLERALARVAQAVHSLAG